MTKGLFITLEGPEGAGKSTQAQRLAAWLRQQGRQVLLTREPGAGLIGGQIRQILLDPENSGLTPQAEALLLAADRAQHVAEALRPALEQGQIVVCDRYTDSFLAYQGYGRGLPLDWLTQLNRQASGGLEPDLTLLLQLPPEQGLARTKSRGGGDRLERETLDFHRRLTRGFEQLAQAEPARFRLIDATPPPEQVHLAIQEQVAHWLAAGNSREEI